MSKRTYMYTVGLKRRDKDLLINGIVEFVVFEDGDGISIISTIPPLVRVKVNNRGEVERVIQHWWNLFLNRLRKFSSSKTIVQPVRFVLVGEENENAE